MFLGYSQLTTELKLFSVGNAVGLTIGFIVFNILTTCFFVVYYKKVGKPLSVTNDRGGNVKIERNKIRLNKKFPWLQKMLPCLNNRKGKF